MVELFMILHFSLCGNSAAATCYTQLKRFFFIKHSADMFDMNILSVNSIKKNADQSVVTFFNFRNVSKRSICWY